jgi:hypothetical protein
VPYDVDATVEAIRNLLGDAALRARLGEGALAAARRSTWEDAVDAQLAIYDEAVRR